MGFHHPTRSIIRDRGPGRTGRVDGASLDAVRAAPCVADALTDDAGLTQVAGRLYAAIAARRQASLLPANGFGPHRPAGAMMGHRRIAVWGLQGGVGKSTVAAALALEAASRRLPTLLVGLGAPDPIPLCLGLRPEPNLPGWQASPTPEGLRAAAQKAETLDVLAGFPDPQTLSGYLPDALEGSGSLPRLGDCAAQAGYAVVVLDVSSPELAASALAAANTLVLVGAPTLPGLLALVEATRLAGDALAGQHRIPPQAVHLVLNRLRASTLRTEEVMRAGSDQRRDFPPLAVAIPDDPAVE